MDESQSIDGGVRTCIVEGCNRPPRAQTKHGKCGPCMAIDSYHRKNPDSPRRGIGFHGQWSGVLCSEDNCSQPVASRGLCAKHYHKKYVPKPSPETARKRRIKHRYGITIEQFTSMVEERGNRCDVCGHPPTEKNTRAHWNGKLCIDHCHDTGEVRGLLCNDCNLAVGYGKTPDVLERAAAYLRLHNRSNSSDHS